MAGPRGPPGPGVAPIAPEARVGASLRSEAGQAGRLRRGAPPPGGVRLRTVCAPSAHPAPV
eukprot:scaffold1393_cov343-Prasinococcus_capsulatus_cf.AAC.11